MKKIYIIALVVSTCVFVSCSSNDEDGFSSSGYFFSVNYNGKDYNDNSTAGFLIGGNVDNCNSNKPLFSANTGQIENSKLFIDAHFIHLENLSDFESNTNNSSELRANVSSSNDCFNNFDFALNVTIDNKQYKLDTSKTSSSTINKVSKASENATEVTFSIQGDFTGNYVENNGSSKTVLTGSYRLPVIVLK